MFSCRVGRLMEFHTSLHSLYEQISTEAGIDPVDWIIATKFAQKWKLSVADALIELHFVDESTMAKCLAHVHELPYVKGEELKYDFSHINNENFDDLINVGAAPLAGAQLAICNPYDDHRGYLSSPLFEREMIVTERSSVLEALQRHRLFTEEA